MKGTITWFHVDDATPQPSKKTKTISDTILIYNKDRETFSKAIFDYVSNRYIHMSKNQWSPTHWAYINLPK